MATPTVNAPPGAHIEARDAVWRVVRVDTTSSGTKAWHVVGVSEIVRDRMPLKSAVRSNDRGVREEAERRERAPFYVATTRARRSVLITTWGKPSPFIA